MKCAKCGALMSEECAFCRRCGEKLSPSANEKNNIEMMFAAAVSDAADRNGNAEKKTVEAKNVKKVKAGGANMAVPALVIIAALLIGSIIANVVQQMGYQSEKSKANRYAKELDELSEEAEEELGEAELKAEALEADLESAAEKYNELEAEYKAHALLHSDCEEKLEFFNEYAVIRPDDGKLTYHKYGCSYYDKSCSFWIYNIDAAIAYEYYPCEYCID